MSHNPETSKTASKSARKTRSVTPAATASAAAPTPAKSTGKPGRQTKSAAAAPTGGAQARKRSSPRLLPAQLAGLSNEERYRYVAEAAYYIAERNGFAGDPVDYWLQAETEVASLIVGS